MSSPTTTQTAAPLPVPQPKPTPVRSPKRTLIHGALWAVGARWSIKGIGFINTAIMARLLMPADYGLVAMSMLIVGLIQALMDFGAATALLRKGEVTTSEINSAWSLRILQSVGVALLLALLAPVAAAYFKEPRVQPVLWVLAGCVAIGGSENIGVILAQKAFQFTVEFRVNVISKLISVVATLVSGYFLRDYRALVIGIATGYVAGLVLGYVLHPYRPRWDTRKMGEIWGVTKWLMLAGVGSFLLRKSDEVAAGRIGSTGDFGLYHTGSDLGRLAVGQLGPAMMRAFLPVLSSIEADVLRTNNAVLKTLAAVNAITLPMGFGMAAIALPFTQLVLGDKWLGAAPFVAIFALVGSAQFLLSPLTALLVLRGHTRTLNTVSWIEFAVFVAASLVLVPHFYLMGMGFARLLASLVNSMVLSFSARRYCHISLNKLLLSIMRPLIGAILMCFLVTHVLNMSPNDGMQCFVGIMAGALFYCAWSIGSWVIFKKPEGLESTVWDALSGRFLRSRKN